jgi:hypothetical protein
MTQRSPIVVLLLSFTGIYLIYWWIVTKDEMNQKFGTQIPTGWHLIIPILNLIWLWKWCKGAEKVTGFSGAVAFIMSLFYLSWLAAFLLQGKFNTVGAGAGGMARAA